MGSVVSMPTARVSNEIRYLLLRDGVIVGHVVSIGEWPAEYAKAWRDEYDSSLVLALVLGGESEDFLLRLPCLGMVAQ